MGSIPTEVERYSQDQYANLKDLSDKMHMTYPRSETRDMILEIGKVIRNDNNRSLRRLSSIADYEGKTRVIAIGDYMSNVLLRPIHEELMLCLKGMSPDMTHKQHLIRSRVKQLMELNCRPSSIDLTAATDRLPVIITETVISEYFQDQILSEI
jgi:hypothetical protein